MDIKQTFYNVKRKNRYLIFHLGVHKKFEIFPKINVWSFKLVKNIKQHTALNISFSVPDGFSVCKFKSYKILVQLAQFAGLHNSSFTNFQAIIYSLFIRILKSSNVENFINI